MMGDENGAVTEAPGEPDWEARTHEAVGKWIDTRRERDAARAAIAAVRELHWDGGGYCIGCCEEWPCPTDKALATPAAERPGA